MRTPHSCGCSTPLRPQRPGRSARRRVRRTPSGGTFLRVGNTLPFSGEEVVKEAFGEVLAPIFADSSLGKRLELDIAGRITNYKTSGQVETWKVGINYELNDAIRFRATRSRDIRAPNLQELFAAGQTLVFTVIDRARQVPNLNGVIAPDSYTAATISGGSGPQKPSVDSRITSPASSGVFFENSISGA